MQFFAVSIVILQMQKIKFITFLSLLIFSQLLVASPKIDSTFIAAELEILQTAKQLSASRYNDIQQDSLDNQLRQQFSTILKRDGSFTYPFDTLKNDVSIVTSSDGKVRIITWYSVGDAGNYNYSGFLQYNDKSAKMVRLFELNDCSDKITNLENQTLTPQNWYGVVYYGIVEKKIDNDVIYTLLGWDGAGLYTTRKIIEPLTFTAKGQPRFGKMMIKFARKKMKRMVFEYNKRATMMIQYDAQLDLIVMDHLSVFGDQDTDNPMFLGPDMSYDALKFDNGTWLYQSNIDYRRPPKKKK